MPMCETRATPHKSNVPEDHYQRIREWLRRRIARRLCLARQVLDVGCGSCELDNYLAWQNHQRVVGVDISDGSFPLYRAPTGWVECKQADAGSLQFLKNGAVDAVLSVHSLHEMESPMEVLREAKRVLNPAGSILVIDFPRGSLAQRLWNEDYYSSREVADMLGEAGFIDVESGLIAQKQLIWAEGRKTARDKHNP